MRLGTQHCYFNNGQHYLLLDDRTCKEACSTFIACCSRLGASLSYKREEYVWMCACVCVRFRVTGSEGVETLHLASQEIASQQFSDAYLCVEDPASCRYGKSFHSLHQSLQSNTENLHPPMLYNSSRYSLLAEAASTTAHHRSEEQVTKQCK